MAEPGPRPARQARGGDAGLSAARLGGRRHPSAQGRATGHGGGERRADGGRGHEGRWGERGQTSSSSPRGAGRPLTSRECQRRAGSASSPVRQPQGGWGGEGGAQARGGGAGSAHKRGFEGGEGGGGARGRAGAQRSGPAGPAAPPRSAAEGRPPRPRTCSHPGTDSAPPAPVGAAPAADGALPAGGGERQQEQERSCAHAQREARAARWPCCRCARRVAPAGQ